QRGRDHGPHRQRAVRTAATGLSGVQPAQVAAAVGLSDNGRPRPCRIHAMTESRTGSRSTTSPQATAFIGGGNMARSLIGGVVARGADSAGSHVAEPVDALREALAREFGVQVHANAADAVAAADAWVFAVKPQVMREVCEDLADRARAARPLAISIAAGI